MYTSWIVHLTYIDPTAVAIPTIGTCINILICPTSDKRRKTLTQITIWENNNGNWVRSKRQCFSEDYFASIQCLKTSSTLLIFCISTTSMYGWMWWVGNQDFLKHLQRRCRQQLYDFSDQCASSQSFHRLVLDHLQSVKEKRKGGGQVALIRSMSSYLGKQKVVLFRVFIALKKVVSFPFNKIFGIWTLYKQAVYLRR